MKTYKYLLLIFLAICSAKLNAQNIGINATGAAPDTTALLDISSTTKGLLIPRMTTAQRNAISAPVNGLIIFNTTTNSLDYYQSSGSTWNQGSVNSGTMSKADSATYHGSSTINTVGTITTGTWNGTTIGISNGGTGQTTANAAVNALLPSQSGNSGKILTTNGTNTSWIGVAKTYIVSSGDQSLTTNAWVSISGLSFAVTAGTTYHFKAAVAYNNIGASGDYVDFGVTGPASPTLLAGMILVTKTGSDIERGGITGYDAGISPGGCVAGANFVIIEGMIIPSASGTFDIRCKARNANKDTIKTGSTLEYW